MAATKPTFKKFTTKPGIAVYPKLHAPDTKFKEAGEYGVKLRLSAEDSEAFIAKIDAEVEAYLPVAKAELQAKINDAKTGPEKAKARKALEELKAADRPYKPAYDDDGNETGEFEFNVKMPASFVAKRGPKAGSVVKMAPQVFDAKGKPMKVCPEIWGGSRLIVAGEMRPFCMPIGYGISLRLSAVQVLTLVGPGQGGRDASAFGFGEEDGFESNPADENGFRDESDAGDAPAGEADGASDDF